MAEVRFYHLTARPLESALPTLLEKCLERDMHAVVKVVSEERLRFLDDHLWTYRDHSFLPHGSARDGDAFLQPVWLTRDDENPNTASVLFLVEGAELARESSFDLVCDLFDGGHEECVAAARKRWTKAKEGGHTLVYYEQRTNGSWTERLRVAAPQ